MENQKPHGLFDFWKEFSVFYNKIQASNTIVLVSLDIYKLSATSEDKGLKEVSLEFKNFC